MGPLRARPLNVAPPLPFVVAAFQLLAGAAFLYLWWLATLFFDLVVVWHYYIRESALLDRLEGSP